MPEHTNTKFSIIYRMFDIYCLVQESRLQHYLSDMAQGFEVFTPIVGKRGD